MVFENVTNVLFKRNFSLCPDFLKYALLLSWIQRLLSQPRCFCPWSGPYCFFLGFCLLRSLLIHVTPIPPPQTQATPPPPDFFVKCDHRSLLFKTFLWFPHSLPMRVVTLVTPHIFTERLPTTCQCYVGQCNSNAVLHKATTVATLLELLLK